MEWKLEMGKHLLKISEMGFNVVRVIGLEVNCKPEYIPDKTNWELRSVDYCDQDEDYPNCLYPVIGYQINENTLARHGDLISELIVAIKTHNTANPDKPLKLMLLTGTGGFTPVAENYASYLDYISERFADEPVIFSYEIISEPYLLGPQFEMTKYEAANMFANFYTVIRENAPSHIISMGSVPWDVFGWDSNVIPADFNAFHLYTNPTQVYDQTEFERYKSHFYWFSQTCEYPWILGEAGLSANDSIHNLDSLYSYLIRLSQVLFTLLAIGLCNLLVL
jgi:hypothetical protein